MKPPEKYAGYYINCIKFDPPPPKMELESRYKIIGKFKVIDVVDLSKWSFWRWTTYSKYDIKYRELQEGEAPDLIVYERDEYETFTDEILYWKGDFYYYFSEGSN